MNKETYDWFSVSKPHDYSVETSKYIYEGKGRTTTYIRTDKPACCPPVFKEQVNQTLATRKIYKDTSKYLPKSDKQLWRIK
jgi:hypothetical protein